MKAERKRNKFFSFLLTSLFLGSILFGSKNLFAKEAVVEKGDTLQKISLREYGTTRLWYKIFKANKTLLKSPNSLEKGMKINLINTEVAVEFIKKNKISVSIKSDTTIAKKTLTETSTAIVSSSKKQQKTVKNYPEVYSAFSDDSSNEHEAVQAKKIEELTPLAQKILEIPASKTSESSNIARIPSNASEPVKLNKNEDFVF
jgi:hypothetical protein